MTFEILKKDLMARIGRFKTKSGIFETPLLFPVVNPYLQPIAPRILEKKFGCEALITNAYIINKNFKEIAIDKGLHKFLDFNGSIMTDSGAYQLLIYKGIEITPKEIVQFQEIIDTDIATILDLPTGWGVTKEYAKYTVNTTLKRAKTLMKTKSRQDIAWVGPIQGGQYLDLIAKSAKEMGKLHFQIHALGSPTPVMEQYKFDVLVDMILNTKMNLPPDRPIHLFGAGHPFMFSLAVALGCDLFDSAAYALFARNGRYLTEAGTLRVDQMEYFPCSCPICNQTDPKAIKSLPKEKRDILLAEHNLYVSLAELQRIKQAITEGRLWEHMEMRAYGHPSLLQALKKLKKYSSFIEKQSPITKKKGIFFFSSLGLSRPEIIRYRKRLDNRYSAPSEAKILLLLPPTKKKPFHDSKEYKAIAKEIQKKIWGKNQLLHICTYSAPFGIIPTELDDIYPLSQNLITSPFDSETLEYVAKQVVDYINKTNYKKIILLNDSQVWKRTIIMACKAICKKKKVPLLIIQEKDPWIKRTIEKLADVIYQQMLSL
jgi:7-cyano-7-deazaguanine tRNA-ribosyltransferase